MLTSVLERYLDECRALVMDEIQEIVPNNRFRPILYNLVLDYPLRSGKAFRPAVFALLPCQHPEEPEHAIDSRLVAYLAVEGQTLFPIPLRRLPIASRDALRVCVS